MRGRVAASLVTLAVVSTLVPLLGRAPRVDAEPVAVGRVHRAYQPTKGKIFVLVIGSDARHGNPDRVRADAIHVVGLNTRSMRGGILNFPRDSWVGIPGHGSGKINEALYLGGPQLVARTVESLTGIRLDYWVLTGFEGFQAIVRGLGGVDFRIRRDIYDAGGSGANLRAGQDHLNGAEALAFVRTRKAFSQGDIARTTNQGRFLLGLLRNLRADTRANPASLLKWLSLGRRHTRLDISPEETFRLGVLASRVKSQRVGNVTVPASVGSVGAASVVFIGPGASSIYARFRSKGYL